jgi:hypothetical protein
MDKAGGWAHFAEHSGTPRMARRLPLPGHSKGPGPLVGVGAVGLGLGLGLGDRADGKGHLPEHYSHHGQRQEE